MRTLQQMRNRVQHPQMQIELQFAEDLEDIDLSETPFIELCRAMGEQLSVAASGMICVRVCGAEESRVLNATYRPNDKPTTVLSFPADVDLDEVQVIGDIALCWPVIVAEANEQNKPLEHHLKHLFVHGVLHLLGYDHQSDEEAHAMERVETGILAQFGVPDPYELRS